jgi:hypothetical protein
LSAATIIQQATADGITLALTPSGTVKATGDRAVVARWAAMIRDNKAGIVAVLSVAANDPADPDVHQRWTVTIPGREVFGFIVPQGLTLEQVRQQYPTAIAIRPTKEVLDPEITGAEQR